MKLIKKMLPLLLLFFLFLGIGCYQEKKSDVKKAITSELGLLKNLDSDTAKKYVTHTGLFPDVTENTELSNEIKDVFSLFFQNFSYKVLEIAVDQKNESATASVRLRTLDAYALAKDFASTLLKKAIQTATVDSSVSTEDTSFSSEERYLILKELLSTNKYDIVETNCHMELQKIDGAWEIDRTYSLENDLVGGLITYLSDPDLLSPSETLAIYFDMIKSMNVNEMSNYLGLSALLTSTDDERNSIASALVEQVHTNFDYKILDSTIDGYRATIETEIISFDSEAILEDYQKKADEYLASPEAVIDGAEARYKNMLSLLLKCIKTNEKTVTTPTQFQLINDGVSWKLANGNTELGTSIFGSLSESPVS